MSVIDNERTKLTATYLNGIAIATFAVGGLAPIVAAMSETSHLNVLGSLTAGICLFVSLILHIVARASLRSLVQ